MSGSRSNRRSAGASVGRQRSSTREPPTAISGGSRGCHSTGTALPRALAGVPPRYSDGTSWHENSLSRAGSGQHASSMPDGLVRWPDDPVTPDRVAVITVSYNTRELTALLLWSLRQILAWESLEIVVVDNGSTDGSAELLAKIATAGGCRLHPQRGQPHARPGPHPGHVVPRGKAHRSPAVGLGARLRRRDQQARRPRAGGAASRGGRCRDRRRILVGRRARDEPFSRVLAAHRPRESLAQASNPSSTEETPRSACFSPRRHRARRCLSSPSQKAAT